MLPIILLACTPTPYNNTVLPPPSSQPDQPDHPNQPTITIQAATTTHRSAPPPTQPSCNEDDGGTSLWDAPETYGVQVRRLTLLGAEGTDDHDLIAVEAREDSPEVLLTEDLSDLAHTLHRPPAGTYDGVALQLFAMRADMDLGLDDFADVDATGYAVRGWMVDDGDIAARDITVEIDGDEYWVAMTDGELVPAQPLVDGEGDTGFTVQGGLSGEEPPADRLRLWSDETFWSAAPIQLSSDDGSNDYRMEIDGGSVTISDGASLSVALWFDTSAVLSWWEGGAADGSFSLIDDCGLRIGPPDITVAITQD